MKVLVNCKYCKKQEEVHSSRAKTYITCSINCLSKLKKAAPNCKCYSCKKEFHIKESRLKKLVNISHICCSRNCSKKLKSDLYTGRNNPNTKYKMIDDNFFKEVNTEAKAYVLGWIASDGHIADNGAITIQVKNTDEQCMKMLAEIFTDELEIKERLEKQQVSLIICSTTMANDICKLLNISPGKKSDIVSFPALNNDQLTWAFIRGYFDGDGSIHKIDESHKTPSCNIASNSLSMINGLAEFTKIPSNISHNGDRIYWEGNNALDFLGKIYSGAKYYLQRKHEQYLDLCTWVPSVSYSRYWKNEFFRYNKTRHDAIAPSKARITDSGYDLVLLEKIKTIGEVELYDTGIKVIPNHGFYFDLVPRSSIIKSGYILANSTGIIDRTYLGNIMVALIKIDKNAPDLVLPNKLVQLIPRPIIHMEFQEISEEEIENSARGEGGFGSTNKLNK